MTTKTFMTAMGIVFLSAALPAAADSSYRARAIAVIKKDFQPRGQASLDRLVEDGLQAVCNRSENKPPEHIAKILEADQMAGVKYPADGKLLGDWKSTLTRFVKVLPHDYRRMVESQRQLRAKGMSPAEAELAAFELNAHDQARVGGN